MQHEDHDLHAGRAFYLPVKIRDKTLSALPEDTVFAGTNPGLI